MQQQQKQMSSTNPYSELERLATAAMNLEENKIILNNLSAEGDQEHHHLLREEEEDEESEQQVIGKSPRIIVVPTASAVLPCESTTSRSIDFNLTEMRPCLPGGGTSFEPNQVLCMNDPKMILPSD